MEPPEAPSPPPPLSDGRSRTEWLWSVPVLLLIGLALREAFSFWTGSPYDFEIWVRTGHWVALGGDPYNGPGPFVSGLSFARPTGALPPPAYLPFWALYTGLAYDGYSVFGGGSRFVYYLLLKQGPIAGDVITGYLLYRLAHRWTGDRKSAFRVLALWMVFPYPILIAAIWGQFDSIAVALLLGALLFEEAVSADLLLGLGIFVKWVTAVLIPFDIVRRKGAARAWSAFAVAVPIGITGAILLALGWGLGGLWSAVVVGAGGIGGGMNWERLLGPDAVFAPVGAGPGVTAVLRLLWLPAVTVVGGYMAWRQTTQPGAPVLEATVAIVAVFLLTRWGLNEQYLVYLLAPLLLDVVAFHPARRGQLIVLVVLGTAYLVVNNALLVPFLGPLGPQFLLGTPGAAPNPLSQPARWLTLDSLALLISLTLAQVCWSSLRGQGAPRPWIWRPLAWAWGRRGRPRPRL